MVNMPITVSVILFVCVSCIVCQLTTRRTITTRKFSYETACLDRTYGITVSDAYRIPSKETCQMKGVDAGPSCVAFFWVQGWSWCRLNQMKHVNRTLNCDSWEKVVYAEDTVNTI